MPGRELVVVTGLVPGFQPATDFSDRDIGLLQHFSHREEAVELARKGPVGYRHAGVLQALRVLLALVAQGIPARGQHICRRQAGQRRRADRRRSPVGNVVSTTQIMVGEPTDH